jgi:hypothetical protein
MVIPDAELARLTGRYRQGWRYRMNHPRTAATGLRVAYKRVSEARRLYAIIN